MQDYQNQTTAFNDRRVPITFLTSALLTVHEWCSEVTGLTALSRWNSPILLGSLLYLKALGHNGKISIKKTIGRF